MQSEDQPSLAIETPRQGECRVKLSGSWCTGSALPAAKDELLAHLSSGTLSFESSGLRRWDSVLLNFLMKLFREAEARRLTVDASGLPAGVARLIALARAVPEKETRREGEQGAWLEQIGSSTLGFVRSGRDMLTFLGEAVTAASKLLTGRAKFRRCDLVLAIQECGAQALPIASLISFLVGLILAFVGAVQLEQFGASIYVADLVAIAMAREMAAIMTGIIMAGRTGAAFAAQLGTMTVNEEIDAMRTLGISPMEFLVLPRLLALSVMMPLLCVYADLVGILGGLVVGLGMLDLTLTQYMVQTQAALDLTNLAIGVVKALVFGVLVALAGCLRGMQCGRSASSVGQAATSAVVLGIVAIIVTDAVFAVVTNVLGI